MTKHHIRYEPALWYAWGQQDAGIGKGLDVFAFAEHHAAQAVEHDAGRTGYLPSVQDSWREYVAERPMPTVAAIDDEVTAFLAKSVDEAGMADLDAIDGGS
jgi:hypothetical protein